MCNLPNSEKLNTCKIFCITTKKGKENVWCEIAIKT